MKQSIQSKILALVLKLLNFRKKVTKKAINHIGKSNKRFVPKVINRFYSTNIQYINSKVIATIERKDKVTNKHIIFFHGGAYIFEISPGHWRLAQKIVEKCSCRMSLLDYPLAPEYSYKDTYDMAQSAYHMLTGKYPDDKFILMGDSAGGGLALALMQKMIEEKHKVVPYKCILLSPWLDLTMSNKDIRDLESKDNILSVEMLKIAGQKYSKGENQENYLLSPINGNFENIPETIIFYGTDELFYADCKKLKSMIDAEKSSLIFKEYPKMQHDWALFPIPESQMLIEEICDFIDE